MTALYRTSLFRLSLAGLYWLPVSATPLKMKSWSPPRRLPSVRWKITAHTAPHSDSATKTATPLNKVPSSVSVIGEEITARNPATLKQALGYTEA